MSEKLEVDKQIKELIDNISPKEAAELAAERIKFQQIIKDPLESLEILPDFFMFTIDARNEKKLEGVIKRIDEQMTNNQVTIEKEIIQVPTIFESIDLKKLNENLKNIYVEVNKDFKYNFITGQRDEFSPSYDFLNHKISWVGVVVSPALKGSVGKGIEYYFDNCVQLCLAYVPEDEDKMLSTIKEIEARMGDDNRRELEEFIAIMKVFRRDAYDKYRILFPSKTTYNKISNDMLEVLGGKVKTGLPKYYNAKGIYSAEQESVIQKI